MTGTKKSTLTKKKPWRDNKPQYPFVFIIFSAPRKKAIIKKIICLKKEKTPEQRQEKIKKILTIKEYQKFLHKAEKMVNKRLLGCIIED